MSRRKLSLEDAQGAAEPRMVNWRGESAKLCWLCGSNNTKMIDHETRECRECSNWYAVFDQGLHQPHS